MLHSLGFCLFLHLIFSKNFKFIISNNINFKDANATLESTKQNVSGALSSWGGWASSLAKSVTEKLDDQLAQMVETENGDGGAGGAAGDKDGEISE